MTRHLRAIAVFQVRSAADRRLAAGSHEGETVARGERVNGQNGGEGLGVGGENHLKFLAVPHPLDVSVFPHPDVGQLAYLHNVRGLYL